MQALLLFFAANLMFDAVPGRLVIGLPRAWHFLHPRQEAPGALLQLNLTPELSLWLCLTRARQK
jgi:hypothetical protein